jgi:hypothetical protein
MSIKAILNIKTLLIEFPVYRGGVAESLIEKMIDRLGADNWRLDLTEEERRILGYTLASDPGQPHR